MVTPGAKALNGVAGAGSQPRFEELTPSTAFPCPWAANGTCAYVANSASNNVTVIDTWTNAPDEHWPLPESVVRCMVFKRQQEQLKDIEKQLKVIGYRLLLAGSNQPCQCNYWEFLAEHKG